MATLDRAVKNKKAAKRAGQTAGGQAAEAVPMAPEGWGDAIAQSTFAKVEFVWPGKETAARVRQLEDGRWVVDADDGVARVRPLVEWETYPSGAKTGHSLLIQGDRLAALQTLGRSGRFARMIYVDAPRIGIDDAAAAFKGDAQLVFSSWLSVMRLHLLGAHRVLRRDGVVVVHVGDTESGYAKLLLDEVFRGQHVGTVVWQRSYGPRNMPGMREFTSTHDVLLIYARQKDALPPVGLRRLPVGYSNNDDDPRGAWRAEHKGAKARRDNSDFDTFVPPYRWRIVEGALPKGIWRLSPLTGVIWGEPEEAGKFPIRIEATDSVGATAVSNLVLRVEDSGQAERSTEVPWLFEEIKTNGALRIETQVLPVGVLGERYSAVVLAAGGKPFRDKPKRPGSGRYWEFARNTLLDAYLSDRVYLGKEKPTAIPHPKDFAPPEGELVVENQQTWWPGRVAEGKSSIAFAGYTEDATKHLKAMRALGLIEDDAAASKPEHLLARLLDIFTVKEDVVLEMFAGAGDLASVALKRGRRFVALGGDTARDGKAIATIVKPRLKAVIDGADKDVAERCVAIKMRADAYIPFDGGGSFSSARLGDWIVARRKDEDVAELNVAAYHRENLSEALLSAEGFVPGPNGVGVSISDQNSAAIVVPENEFLTSELASDWVSKAEGKYATFSLYYFRASDDFDASTLPIWASAKRVPFDLGI
jgi:hypothetical protein